MMDSHFQELFALGLGIKAPWYIKSVDLVPSLLNIGLMEMHIEIDFTEGAKFNLDGTSGKYAVHDTKEHTWRHLNFFQYRCYVKARVPRVINGKGEVKTVSVPWEHTGSGFTSITGPLEEEMRSSI